MASDDMDRVVPLGQMDDFAVAEGDPDVRGWEVLASDGRRIGDVDELLVDAAAMKVRYLDVDLDDGVVGEAGERHVLIPIGYARLDRERDCVRVDALAAADLAALPAYDQGPLSREHETSVRDRFREAHRGSAAESGGSAEEDPFYASDAFDDARFYGRRHEGAAGNEVADQLGEDWKTRRVGQVGDL
jgi:hypothetical protein